MWESVCVFHDFILFFSFFFNWLHKIVLWPVSHTGDIMRNTLYNRGGLCKASLMCCWKGCSFSLKYGCLSYSSIGNVLIELIAEHLQCGETEMRAQALSNLPLWMWSTNCSQLKSKLPFICYILDISLPLLYPLWAFMMLSLKLCGKKIFFVWDIGVLTFASFGPANVKRLFETGQEV